MDPKPSKMEDDIYGRLVNEAPYVAGDAGEPISPEAIPWFDPELLREGQDFISRNYFAQDIALMGALVFGTTFRSVTTVLLRTGTFSTPSRSLLRHVRTEVHVNRWFTTDLLEPTSEGFRDLQHVRQLHLHALRQVSKRPLALNEAAIEGREEKERIVEALQKDLVGVDTSSAPTHLLTYDPPLLFSQFDFAMVLFGMYATIYLFPGVLGVRDRRGMKGFVHFWAVVGRLLGLQDRFNPAIVPDRDAHLRILRNMMFGSLKGLDVTQMDLSQTYVQALGRLGLRLNFKAVLYAGLRNGACPEFKGDHLYRLLSWWDVVGVRGIQLGMLAVYYVPGVRSCMNQLSRLVAWYGRKRTGRERRVKV